MGALVRDQVSPPAKAKAALGAFIPFFTGVNPLVDFKHALLTEFLSAMTAFKRLFLRGHFWFSCRFLRSTLLLCVGFFMGPHVSAEETGTPETLKADGAVVWPHSRVYFQMLLQVSWGVKALIAHKADKRALSCVRSNVHHKSRALPEAFVAGGAVEGSFSGVNALVL